MGLTYSELRLVMPLQELGTDPSRELLNRVLHNNSNNINLSNNNNNVNDNNNNDIETQLSS